jgi:hypothetical protein
MRAAVDPSRLFAAPAPDVTPFRTAAVALHRAGWHPIPLPPRAKKEPPKSFTGYSAKAVTPADIGRWTDAEPADSNVAVRMPAGVIGIDVDDYGDKHGADDLAALEAIHGPLPVTYTSTSRGEGSRSSIRFYRVPIGMRFRTALSTAIEVIQPHHRYAVVAPSIHPEGRAYCWYDSDGEARPRPPDTDDAADLPDAWVEAFEDRRPRGVVGDPATTEQIHDFIEAHAEARLPKKLTGIRTSLDSRTKGRHDTLVEHACWVAREAAAGSYSAADGFGLLHDWWRRVMADQGRLDGTEFADAIAWAVGQAEAEPERIANMRAEVEHRQPPPNVDPVTGEIIGSTEVPEDKLASFDPIDLGPAWRGERVRPVAEVFKRDDGVALLLPGINYLFGDSGDGKSMVALIAALTEVRQGHPAIWVTYEDANEDLIVDRLKLLGATAIEASLVNFITPQSGMSDGADRIAGLALSTDARLLVLDSVGEAMALGGVNEDRDNEVGPWFRQTLRLIHDRLPSLTILPIDHSTKSKDNPLFPSGSKRKRAAPTGRMFLLNVGSSGFAKGAIGYVQLVVAKDRGGSFQRGAIAADVMLDATTTPYQWRVSAPRDGDTYAPKVRRRNAADRVLEVVLGASVGLNAGEVLRIVNGPNMRRSDERDLVAKTVKNALTKLADRPGVVRQEAHKDHTGKYVPTTWFVTGPDRDGSAS